MHFHWLSADRKRACVMTASALSLALGTVGAAQATELTVYQTDFSSGLDLQWSAGSVLSDATLGEYLGNFSLDGATTLTLDGLPSHTQITLSFDLYLFNTWDGNNLSWGPDYFSISSSAPAIGGSWTFTNHQPDGQSYPQAVPTENYGGLGNMGATYVYRGLGPLGDGASWTAAHTASTFSVTFGGPTTQTDEWWGIDNVQVSVTTIPEPSAALLLIAGLGALGMAARLRLGSAV